MEAYWLGMQSHGLNFGVHKFKNVPIVLKDMSEPGFARPIMIVNEWEFFSEQT